LLQIPKSATIDPLERSVVLVGDKAAIPLASTKPVLLNILSCEIHSLYLFDGLGVVSPVIISAHEILTFLHLIMTMSLCVINLAVLAILEGVAAVRKTSLVIPILFYSLVLPGSHAWSVSIEGIAVRLLLGLVAAWAVHIPRLVYRSLRRHALLRYGVCWLLISTLILCPQHLFNLRLYININRRVYYLCC